MRLFLKENTPLIFIQCVQFAFLFLLLWLDGFRNYTLLLYGLLVNLVILAVYLFFHYYRRRHVYNKLSSRAVSMEELVETTGTSPIGIGLDQLTRTQYQLFMEQLKQAEDAQKQHLTFMDRWVHQMKTPLSVIELTAQNLDQPESSNIREETERIKNGLHTVLNMARLRTIQEDFHIKPVVLEELLHEVNHENKRFYIRNKIYPHLHIGESKLMVETDEKWLFFIANQIIQNAVKYSAGKSNRIDIYIKKQGKQAVLEITDYGVGIPAQDKKRIFQAFFTGENGRIYRESTGMGLYLTKEVADYLGHRIELDSTEGKGTTFRILFTPTQTLS